MKFKTFLNEGISLISVAPIQGHNYQLDISRAVRGQYHRDEGTVILLNAHNGTAQILPTMNQYRYPDADLTVCMLSKADAIKYVNLLKGGMDLYESLSILDSM